eukprot:CAMPEP_0176445618 /NCGR_PEP_ID=MMETSP0127-20121128/23821_1 /TAXON_ID=938130 /ORGANISM="Platyophrya macrostoma, Strain WH" /LENGTH=215 /DNA_ID=CAMNT_0017831463 /DNA_START=20 /DNA_END=667 /DNA_ORIENTATION=-
MQFSDVLPIKEKLAISRAVWSKMSNEKFLKRLYCVLNNPLNQHIISWSNDGRYILIKDEELIASKIIKEFDGCASVLNFLQKLEDCLFAEVYNQTYPRGNAYEHIYLTRDIKPVFQLQKLPRKNRFSMESALQQEETTIEPALRKIAKTQTNDEETEEESIDTMMDQFFDQYYRQIPGFSEMISEFYTNINSQENKKKCSRLVYLSLSLMDKYAI